MKHLMVLAVFSGSTVCVQAEPSGHAGKSLESYSKADRLWLGTFGGDVAVNPSEEVLATRPGEIEWLENDGTEVRKGTVLGYSSAIQIRQSAGQLALDEDAVAIKLKAAEWQHHEKLLGLQRQVEEQELRISKLSLTTHEKELLGKELVSRLADEGRELKKELKVLQEKLDPNFRAGELNLEQRQIHQDIAKARADHEDLVRSLEILSPNDGILHIAKSGYVRSNDVVATLERRGNATVSLQLLDPEARSEAPESLAVAVSTPTGEVISGSFSNVDRIPNARIGPEIYHFKLDPKSEKLFTTDFSGERMVTLYKLLHKEARIIPKADFLFSFPQEIQRLGWAGFLRNIWPTARIVHIGPRSIALAEKE